MNCPKFEKFGFCDFGGGCKFIHRHVMHVRHGKSVSPIRRKPCHRFFLGGCQNGNCTYIHLHPSQFGNPILSPQPQRRRRNFESNRNRYNRVSDGHGRGRGPRNNYSFRNPKGHPDTMFVNNTLLNEYDSPQQRFNNPNLNSMSLLPVRPKCVPYNLPGGCRNDNCEYIHVLIPKEQKMTLIIVGAHGSGKSTLANTFLRNFCFKEGRSAPMKYLDSEVEKSFNHEYVIVDIDNYGDPVKPTVKKNKETRKKELIFKLGSSIMTEIFNEEGVNSIIFTHRINKGLDCINFEAISLLYEFLGPGVFQKRFIFVITNVDICGPRLATEIRDRFMKSSGIPIPVCNILYVDIPSKRDRKDYIYIRRGILRKVFEQKFESEREYMDSRNSRKEFCDPKWRKGMSELIPELKKREKLEEEVYFMERRKRKGAESSYSEKKEELERMNAKLIQEIESLYLYKKEKL